MEKKAVVMDQKEVIRMKTKVEKNVHQRTEVEVAAHQRTEAEMVRLVNIAGYKNVCNVICLRALCSLHCRMGDIFLKTIFFESGDLIR